MEKEAAKTHGGAGPATETGHARTVTVAPASLAAFSTESVDLLLVVGPLERMTREAGQVFLEDCRKVLKKDGVVRIVTPNLATLVNDYAKGKLDRHPAVIWAPESRARLLNEGMRAWGHLFLYDPAELEAALKEAGFKTVVKQPKVAKSLAAEFLFVDGSVDLGQLMIYEARP